MNDLRSPIVYRALRRLKFEINWSLRGFVSRSYHRNWYMAGTTWAQAKWMGFPIQQCPLDLQRYQELIHSIRPRAIVQTGVNQGGSLLFFAHMLDALEDSDEDRIVVGIDIALTEKARELRHPRIRLLEGDSKGPDMVQRVREIVGERAPIIISLDSDHGCSHVLEELRAYAPLVVAGGALVVEDTNLNGHPVFPDFGPGPTEAIAEWKSDPLSERFTEVGSPQDPNWISFHTWFKGC